MIMRRICLFVGLMTLLTAIPLGASDRELLQAARMGDLPLVERLLQAGAGRDPRKEVGETPLLVSIQTGHRAVARRLIEAGADINAQARNLDTPWLLAGARGEAELLTLMIPKGPDLSIRNRFGGNALIPACERAHVEAAKVLLTTRIDVNHVNNLGWTCLLEIVVLGNGGPRHQQVTRLVLDAGADPNIADKDGITPLAHARKKGQTEIARMIEAAGGR
jgi:uncharacterized protein